MKKILVGLLAIFTLASCGKNIEAKIKKGPYAHTTNSGVTITIAFDTAQKRVNGRVANGYFGTYKIEGNKITFGPIASTMMMGPEAEMAVEGEFLEFLNSGPKTIEVRGDKLVLSDKNGIKYTFNKAIDG